MHQIGPNSTKSGNQRETRLPWWRFRLTLRLSAFSCSKRFLFSLIIDQARAVSKTAMGKVRNGEEPRGTADEFTKRARNSVVVTEAIDAVSRKDGVWLDTILWSCFLNEYRSLLAGWKNYATNRRAASSARNIHEQTANLGHSDRLDLDRDCPVVCHKQHVRPPESHGQGIDGAKSDPCANPNRDFVRRIARHACKWDCVSQGPELGAISLRRMGHCWIHRRLCHVSDEILDDSWVYFLPGDCIFPFPHESDPILHRHQSRP